MLRQVDVDPIPGRNGWLMYSKLKERLGEGGESAPAFRLVVTLDDEIIGLGIRGDRATTRERRTLRARYQLLDLATGQVILDSTAGSDAGIDVVSSEYATVAAEQIATERLADRVADDIVSRLGVYATRTGTRR
jgi:LPS-assembly lipoprotein